jgi:hypothetical protein
MRGSKFAALRAGALQLAGTAADTGLSMASVTLGFALHGQAHGLDHGARHARRVTVAYLLSPGAPTRSMGERLFGDRGRGVVQLPVECCRTVRGACH